MSLSRVTGSTNWSEREMFYLTTHSTHFIYGYMASYIWLRTILIVRKETCCPHIGYSYRLTARVLLYAPSHRQDNTYHGLCCTSRVQLINAGGFSLRYTQCHTGYQGMVVWVEKQLISDHSTDRIVQTTTFVTPVISMTGTRNSSMGPAWRIDAIIYCTMSKCFTMELRVAPISITRQFLDKYVISLPLI